MKSLVVLFVEVSFRHSFKGRERLNVTDVRSQEGENSTAFSGAHSKRKRSPKVLV